MSAAAFDTRSFVDSLPARPGVYRMLDGERQKVMISGAQLRKAYLEPMLKAH